MENSKDTKPDHDQVDLIEVIKTIWKGRKTIISVTALFILIGLAVTIFSEEEYTAHTTMIPQSKEGGGNMGGSLGGLAAMAGINLGNSGGELSIPPSLYPKIVSSIPFQKELMQTPLSILGQANEVTFYDYYKKIHKTGVFGYIKRYTFGLPGIIMNAIKGNHNDNTYIPQHENKNLLTISKYEKELIKKLRKQFTIEVNSKDGDIKLTATMPEAKAAAQLTDHARKLLQSAITDFKVQKANEQLSFVEERYIEKKEDFETVQKKLALFRDRNRNVSSALAQTEQERLQAEYNLTYSVYSELAKQLEAQKMQVKENTPVFTIIEPVSIPFERSAPNRLLILIVWAMLGGVVGIGVTLGSGVLDNVKSRWQEK